MKTKKYLLGILIPIVVLFISSLISSGCGSADPYYENVKQYEAGEWKPGWWYDGMSDKEVKAHIDGIIDTKARQMALEFFEKRYTLNSPTSTTDNTKVADFGTVAVWNATSRILKIGADRIFENSETSSDQNGSGLMDYDWTMEKNSTVFTPMIPGKYRKWYFDRSGNKKFSDDTLIVGAKTSWFVNQYVSGSIVVYR